ncbi:MAG: hypothetical protein RL701_3368 [Pseudomonadota bacterium]
MCAVYYSRWPLGKFWPIPKPANPGAALHARLAIAKRCIKLAACLCSLTLTSCLIWLPSNAAPRKRRPLTLDVVWEAVLQTPTKYGFLSSRGRTSFAEASARCTPVGRCKALVYPRRWGRDQIYMRVDVVGLKPGPVDVEVRFREHDSNEWGVDHLYLEFLPAPTLPVLKLGHLGPPPKLFMFEDLSKQLLELGFKGPARCTQQDDIREWYTCYGAEEFENEWRYASCETSARCQTGVFLNQFELQITRDMDSRRVVRMDMNAYIAGRGRLELGSVSADNSRGMQ